MTTMDLIVMYLNGTSKYYFKERKMKWIFVGSSIGDKFIIDGIDIVHNK